MNFNSLGLSILMNLEIAIVLNISISEQNCSNFHRILDRRRSSHVICDFQTSHTFKMIVYSDSNPNGSKILAIFDNNCLFILTDSFSLLGCSKCPFQRSIPDLKFSVRNMG